MTSDSQSPQASWDRSTSRSLLAHAQHDDASAWTRLVSLYAPLVAAWCRRWGVAEQDVLDLLQEVFAAVSKNLTHFRKEQPEDTFRGWLLTIARNKVRDHYRRRTGQPAAVGGTEASLRMAQVFDPQSEPAMADANEEAAFSDVIRRALEAIRGEFHEHTWQAFWGVAVEGRAAADVAKDLAMQPGAVRVAKSRVLLRLRRELGDLPE
jgi:RNA polymerase sigma-70 factor, ECF subfamily